MRKESGAAVKMLSINLSFWESGGMSVYAETEKLMKDTFGISPLKTETGTSSLAAGLVGNETQFMVMQGNYAKIGRFITGSDKSGTEKAIPTDYANEGTLSEKLLAELVNGISKILKIRESDIYQDANMSEFGFDSITFTEYCNYLNEKFELKLMPSIFYEYETLDTFAEYLTGTYHKNIAAYFQKNGGATAEVLAAATAEHPAETFDDESIPETEERGLYKIIKTGIRRIDCNYGMYGIMPQSDDPRCLLGESGSPKKFGFRNSR